LAGELSEVDGVEELVEVDAVDVEDDPPASEVFAGVPPSDDFFSDSIAFFRDSEG
jgi:hypothetical protein